MSKLPIISGAECVKALEKVGFLVDRQRGSHIILVREDPRATVSVPAHKELDRGTLGAIIRQVGLRLMSLLRFYIMGEISRKKSPVLWAFYRFTTR